MKYMSLIKIVKEDFLPYGSGRIQSPAIISAADIIQQFIGDTDRENFVVLFLNTKNEINGINLVSVGSFVHPREVFKPAILANASAIIVGHNHPSGDTLPSDSDIAITKKLKAAGELLDIPLLDYMIIGCG